MVDGAAEEACDRARPETTAVRARCGLEPSIREATEDGREEDEELPNELGPCWKILLEQGLKNNYFLYQSQM